MLKLNNLYAYVYCRLIYQSILGKYAYFIGKK